MSSLKRHEGYLLVDHSASPGLPPEIARQAGYDPRFCGPGKTYEAATLTCSHCGNAYAKNPARQRARPYCRSCDHYICDICDAKRSDPNYVHIPFKQLADIALECAIRDEPLGSLMDLVVPPSIIVP